MGYAAISDFNRYFENFATIYYGNSANPAGTVEIATSQLQLDIEASFGKLNTILDGFQRIPIVPIGTNIKTGSYHPYLIEANACDTIYTKLYSRHAPEYSDGLPEWMRAFGTRVENILFLISQGNIVLDTDTTNRGIGYPIRVAGTGQATMYTNWDSGFYSASDYPKELRFKIIDTTTTGSNVGQAGYQISYDAGVSWEDGTRTTGTEWQSIVDGVKVRWAPGLGTIDQHIVNDQWKVNCIPMNIQHVSTPSFYRTFGRG
jgi:hypothetical protein